MKEASGMRTTLQDTTNILTARHMIKQPKQMKNIFRGIALFGALTVASAIIGCSSSEAVREKDWTMPILKGDVNGINQFDLSGNGKTYLMKAVIGNDMTQVRYLLENGARVNTRDNDGKTALMHAASMETDMDARLHAPRGVYVWADCNVRHQIVGTLIANGADVNAKDNDGWTALMYVADGDYKGSNIRLKVTQMLLENGAYVNARNNAGETALSIAINRSDTGIVNLLRSHGAR